MSTRTFAAVLTAAVCTIGCAERADRVETPRGSSPSDTTPLAKAQVPLRPISAGHIIDAIEVEALRREGLSDPIAQVVDSLLAHPEVIPHEGALGGRMGFYSARGVHILDESWVYAEFDDGHVQGRGIFRYTVQADSSLAFEVVHSEVD